MSSVKPESPAAPAQTREVVFRVRGLEKSFALPDGGKLPVLRGLDLDIYRSDFMVIQGKSGIGKSTLLHLLGMLDRPDGGEILFEGRDVASSSVRRRATLRARAISFVFQFYYLLPEFTALENVLLPGKISHSILKWLPVRNKSRERALQLLDLVGIADRASHRPNQLSGGERQRVALARAMFNEPAVLLCDEPTGNLDLKTSEEMHRLLADLNAETRQTLVVVTHDPGLADYASRVVHIVDGLAQED